jgi:hypothetical protein
VTCDIHVTVEHSPQERAVAIVKPSVSMTGSAVASVWPQVGQVDAACMAHLPSVSAVGDGGAFVSEAGQGEAFVDDLWRLDGYTTRPHEKEAPRCPGGLSW